MSKNNNSLLQDKPLELIMFWRKKKLLMKLILMIPPMSMKSFTKPYYQNAFWKLSSFRHLMGSGKYIQSYSHSNPSTTNLQNYAYKLFEMSAPQLQNQFLQVLYFHFIYL